MEKQFIPYTEALALKELGFDESCFGYFNTSNNELFINNSNNRTGNDDNRWCSAPLWQQAFDFFNENFKLSSHVDIFSQTHLGDNYYYQIVNFADVISPETTVQVYGFKTSYDAKLACLKKLITYLQ
jgi:hypothetical protein